MSLALPAGGPEVRRCCYLRPAVVLAARLAAPSPVALIEAGASAGLNLRLDGYAYDYGTPAISVSSGSPLTFQCELRGSALLPLAWPAPGIAWRAGIDLNPLDPGDGAWLRALVWADHPGRARLLDHALRAALTLPPAPVHAGDAAGLLPAIVASAPQDAAVCVMHTAFLAHLTPPERARFERQVAAASAERPVYWVSAETRADASGPRLRLAFCQNGTVVGWQALGRYQSHGAWLEWTAEGARPPHVTG
jgi:hypothetical protein